MILRVTGYVGASQFAPAVPTLAIRIFDSYPGSHNTPEVALQKSPLFIETLSYIFDDLDIDEIFKNYPELNTPETLAEWDKMHVIFSQEIANKMLIEIERNLDSCQEILLHCTLGCRRSPAVAIAIAECFKLGNSNLKARYPNYNSFVYRQLVEAHNGIR